MRYYILFLVMLFMTACPAIASPDGTQDDYCNASSVVYVTMPSGVKCGLHFKRMPVGLGSRYNDIITKMGKPMDEGVFEGSYYMTYPNYDYAFSFYVDYNATIWNDQEFIGIAKKYGKVVRIDEKTPIEICGCGVKVGMTTTEIKKILGKPSSEEKTFEAAEEFGLWDITYSIKNSVISFTYDIKDSKTISALIINKDVAK